MLDDIEFHEATVIIAAGIKKTFGDNTKVIEIRRSVDTGIYVTLTERGAHELAPGSFHTHAVKILDDLQCDFFWGHYDMPFEEAHIDFRNRVPHHRVMAPVVD